MQWVNGLAHLCGVVGSILAQWIEDVTLVLCDLHPFNPWLGTSICHRRSRKRKKKKGMKRDITPLF